METTTTWLRPVDNTGRFAQLAATGVLLCLAGVSSALPVIPESYTYIVPPQGGNPYPDSGNELNDDVYPTRSWGTRTIRNFAEAAPFSGWQFVDPKIRFDFGRTVNIGSLILSADDGNGAAGVYFPEGVTIEMGGQTTTRSIADPVGAGPGQEFLTGLNLTGDSLTLTVDGGNRNWTMLSEIDFDSSDLTFNGFESGVQTTVNGKIESPLGTTLSQLVSNRVNGTQLVTDTDGTAYSVDSSGRLVPSGVGTRIFSEVRQSTADAFTEATILAVNDLNDDGSPLDQIAAAMGSTHASVASQNGLFGALQSSVEATAGWWDYFVIDGDVGDGILTLNFDVEGQVSGDDARIQFSLEGQNAFGELLNSTTPFYADEQTHGGIGFFNELYSVDIPFTFGEIFELNALLEIFATGNSAVDFLDTVKINQLVLPDGASLRSSAIAAGLISLDRYNVVSRSQLMAVPAPGSNWLLLIGAIIGLGCAARGRERLLPSSA